MLGQLKDEATDALENLRDLARGIYPPLLADKGLAAALESQARKSSVPVSLESDGLERYPQEVEAAVYFCCLEALQNIAKYAEASTATIRSGRRVRHARVRGDRRRPRVRSRLRPATAPGSRGWPTGSTRWAGRWRCGARRGEGTTVAGRVPQSSDVRLASPRHA